MPETTAPQPAKRAAADWRPLTLPLQLNKEQLLYEKQQRLLKLIEEGKSYNRPSWLKYGFLFLVAGVVDIVDLADFTGIGIIFSKIVSITGTGIIYFTFWLTDNKLKRAQVYSDDALTAIVELQETVSQMSRLAMRTSRLMRNVPGFKGLARRLPRAMVNLRKVARRSPVTKILIGGVVNLIPWLAIVNLMLFWIYLSYRDEKRTFREAKEVAIQAEEQLAFA